MANFNMNKVILGGRLTGDPEMKQSQSGIAFATFSIAVNRRVSRQQDANGMPVQNQQPTADFFNCTAFRNQAEFICRYFHRASSICIIGQVQNNTYTDQQGNKRTYTNIVVDEAFFVDSKSEGGAYQQDGSQNYQQGYQQGYQPNYQQSAPQEFAQDGNVPPFASQPANDASGNFKEINNDDDLPF